MTDEASRFPVGGANDRFAGDMTREVIRAFYEVCNILHHGLLESSYAGALQREFELQGIPARREVLLKVAYKGAITGVYRADFVIGERLVLELKALSKVGDTERRQLLHYLRLTGMPLGLILNFSRTPKVMRVING